MENGREGGAVDENSGGREGCRNSASLREDVDYFIHEIRTPLTAIYSSAELLENTNLDQNEQSMLLRIIRSEAARLNELLDDFTSRGLHDTSPWLLHSRMEAIDLGMLAREIVARFYSRAKKHPILLKAPENFLPVRGDRNKLLMVLRNLIGNAIKYSPDGGLIRLQVQETDRGIEFSVIDQGVGIAEEDMEKIFQPSCRGPYGEKPQRGMGFGLTIVASIIKSHGGSIRVQSELGRGTTFHVTLPRMN